MIDATEAWRAADDGGDPPRRLAALWERGENPDLRAFLAREGELSPAHLAATLCVDQRERWTRGERIEAEAYFRDWPQILADHEAALDVVFNEFRLRELGGEAPAAEEYQRRFPTLAELFRQQLGFHRAVGPSAVPSMAAGPAVVLEVLSGPHQGGKFRFNRRETFLVGRASDVNLQLIDDAHFSRHHFLLEVNPPHCHLRDLGSSNGTFVNDRRVTERALQDGDVVSAGRTRLRVSLPQPATQALPAGPEPDTAPDVPDYAVERSLGHGGMGAVYLARRLATGERCALKLILPDVAADERARKLFLREISVLRQLHHPRIVRFHEMGLHRGRFFFAMDYVETVDTEAALAAEGHAGRVRLACGLACQALEGLEYAHARGFVHRDVKPANLLVSREGRAYAARVADFGLAKSFENAGLSGMTHEGQVLGTVRFMAPEQVLLSRDAGPPADLYSLGATLYYLLSGSTPHEFRGRRDPLAVILEESPLPLQRHAPWVPDGLADAIHKALAREPAGRFAGAAAMRRALLPYAG